MNKSHIEELCRKNRTGQIIKLMNDNAYLWSRSDFEYIIYTTSYNNVIFMYVIENHFHMLSSDDIINIYNGRTSCSKEFYRIFINKYNISKRIKLDSMHDILNRIYEYSLYYTFEYMIKYILSDIVLKCLINVYDVKYEDTHYLSNKSWHCNEFVIAKYIMSDEIIFRIYKSDEIGHIHIGFYDESLEQYYCDEYYYKWTIDYDHDNHCQYMYAENGCDDAYLCHYCGCEDNDYDYYTSYPDDNAPKFCENFGWYYY